MSDVLPSVRVEELLRHRAWVRSLARSLVRDEAGVDDLEQDTWVAALEHPPASARAATTWLGRVVRNRATDLLRARRRRDAREAASARPEATPSAADTVARADAHRRVVDEVMSLDEPYRTAVLLRFFDCLPPSAVAQRTGVPVETARTHIRRGVERLRERLAPRGDEGGRSALLLLAEPWTAQVPEAGTAATGTSAATGTTGSTSASGATAAAAAGATAMAFATKHLLAAAIGTALLLAAGVAVVIANGVARNDATSSGPDVATASPGDSAAARTATPRARRVDAPPDETPAPDGAAPPSPSSPALRAVRVRREDNGPVEGLTVVLCVEGQVARAERVGPSGEVALPATDAERAVIVAGCGLAAQRVALPAGEGAAEIVVPVGAVVAGRVLVDGADPAEPVTVALVVRERLLAQADLPDDAIPACGDEPPDTRGVRGVATVGGRFRFAGLPAGCRVHLVTTSWDYLHEDGTPPTAVAPADVVVRLLRKPRLVGRVVLRGSGRPFEGALVQASWEEEHASGTDSATSEAGRFRIALTNRDAAKVRLAISDAEGLTVLSTDVEGPFRGDRDLGDIAVPDPSELVMRLLVTDGDGRPVAGAVAAVPGALPWTSQPSGADGHLDVPAAVTAKKAVVCGLGYRAAEIDVAPSGGDRRTVVLEPGAILRMKVGGAGAPAEGAVLRLTSSQPVFDEPEWTVVCALREPIGGTHASSSERSDADESSAFTVPADGVVVIPWLRAAVPFRLDLFDRYGETIASREVRLRPAEQREETLDVASRPRTVRLRVESPDGRPVPSALVVVRAPWSEDDESAPPGRPLFVTRADAAGRCDLAGVYGAKLALFVEGEGLAPWWTRDFATARVAEDPVPIRLAKGTTLIVRTRSADGARVVPEMVSCEPVEASYWVPGHLPLCGEAREDGDVEVRGLPASGDVWVTVESGDTSVRVRATTTQGTVDVRLSGSPVEEK